MNDVEKRPQLRMSLDVGEQPEDMPIVGSVKVGAMGIGQDLYKRDEVTITIADADGAVVATATGRVTGVNHKDHEETRSAPAYTERVHTITPDA